MKRKSKNKRKRALNGTDTGSKTTAAKVKHSAIATGKDLLIGVIGGGIAGAVIGKPSLLIGAGVTGYGHFANKPSLTTFGIGMMAASGFNTGSNTTQGVDGFSAEEVKARVMSFKDSIASKLFLDKIIKKKNSGQKEDVNGMGSVQYFTYPDQNKELDFSALDHLEKQIQKSGAEYQKSIRGTEDEETIQGNDDETSDFSSTSY
jgi:hypothetical protein